MCDVSGRVAIPWRSFMVISPSCASRLRDSRTFLSSTWIGQRDARLPQDRLGFSPTNGKVRGCCQWKQAFICISLVSLASSSISHFRPCQASKWNVHSSQQPRPPFPSHAARCTSSSLSSFLPLWNNFSSVRPSIRLLLIHPRYVRVDPPTYDSVLTFLTFDSFLDQWLTARIRKIRGKEGRTSSP